MNNCQNTLLFVLLILVLLYLKNTEEGFENEQNIPKCNNPQFTMTGTGNDMEYCAEIDGVGNGCQSYDYASGRDKRLAAFSIFGSYIDNLDTKDTSDCMKLQGQTLSEWGLCDKQLLNQIKEFKYDENTPRIKAIESACSYYEKGFQNNRQRIQ
jgi:hypothetical protein